MKQQLTIVKGFILEWEDSDLVLYLEKFWLKRRVWKYRYLVKGKGWKRWEVLPE